ncbi:trans-sulfuration enzyme family protein [candidate division KSB1 bacterium]
MPIQRKLATYAIHGDEIKRGTSGPVTTPIYQTTTYVFPDSDSVEGYMVRGEREHYIYTRYGNPTQTELDRRMALLEGAEDALFFSSGMAAITSAILSVLDRGDELITIPSLYGQALNFFRKELTEKYGILVKFVDIDKLYNLKKHISDKTKLVYLESPTNPNLLIVDIRRITEQAKALNLKTMIDSTFASPVNQQPISLGVDYVVHSGTKYLGGHSDILAGVAVGPKDFIKKCHDRMHIYGPTLDPFAAFLMLRSLKTLEVRVHRQNKNAMKLAEYFNNHPKIEETHYPGLPDNPFHEIAKKQMTGFGGMINVAVKGGKDEARKVADNLTLALNATSLGGVETLVSIPVITSHVWLSPDELEKARVKPSMIRISVGLEHPDDIIADFDQALNTI